ncbi:MAG TPA: hypothetical protein [Caudoviricetes sp.]|nr:MAG TPA: hypothetical protein [Caudoviricetes sp.]
MFNLHMTSIISKRLQIKSVNTLRQIIRLLFS